MGSMIKTFNQEYNTTKLSDKTADEVFKIRRDVLLGQQTKPVEFHKDDKDEQTVEITTQANIVASTSVGNVEKKPDCNVEERPVSVVLHLPEGYMLIRRLSEQSFTSLSPLLLNVKTSTLGN